MVGHSLVACLHLLVPVIREDLVAPVGLVVQGVVGVRGECLRTCRRRGRLHHRRVLHLRRRLRLLLRLRVVLEGMGGGGAGLFAVRAGGRHRLLEGLLASLVAVPVMILLPGSWRRWLGCIRLLCAVGDRGGTGEARVHHMLLAGFGMRPRRASFCPVSLVAVL